MAFLCFFLSLYFYIFISIRTSQMTLPFDLTEWLVLFIMFNALNCNQQVFYKYYFSEKLNIGIVEYNEYVNLYM